MRYQPGGSGLLHGSSRLGKGRSLDDAVKAKALAYKIWLMEQRLYCIMSALRSLYPLWVLMVRMVVVYFRSCANFVFEGVAVFPAWESQTQRLVKQVAVVALCLLLGVRNLALYGTLASLGFGLPDVLFRFRLRQVRGLPLALNIRNALALAGALFAYSASLRVVESPCYPGGVPSIVCTVALGDAPVWCECGPALLGGPVDVVTYGSRDGEQVGWSTVVVSSLGVVAEAWFGCAMVGVSLWVAEWCGEALALWLLSVLGVPVTSLRSFVADNRGATFGKDGGRASSVHALTSFALVTRPPCSRVGRLR